MRLMLRATLVVSALLIFTSGNLEAMAVTSPVRDDVQSSENLLQLTTVNLSRPVKLQAVATSLAKRNLLPISFLHISGKGRVGGHVSRGSSLDGIAASYRHNYRDLGEGDEPQVTQVIVRGIIPGIVADLGADLPLERVVQSDRSTLGKRKIVEFPVLRRSLAVSTQPAQNPAPPPGAPKWAPSSGRTVASVESGGRRAIEQTMTWNTQEDINDFGDDKAYEHDFKLRNTDNVSPEVAGVGSRPLCAPGQSNDFWATRVNATFTTTYPVEAKPYFDTDSSDGCDAKDFTIGLYHPKLLKPAVAYTTKILTDAGNQDSSPYVLNAQRLARDCDSGPFCVGVRPGGDGWLLVGPTRGVAPGCRRWAKKPQQSGPC